MSKKILIDGTFPHQYRVALVNAQNTIEEIEYESANLNQIKGNIYLAKIVRIEPGLQAAFIDYGGIKNGFLPFSEIHPGYYNIPVADIQKYSSELSNLQEISSPKLSKDDLEDEPSNISSNQDKDLDISQIEKLIDEETSDSLDNSDSERSNDDKLEPLPLYKQYKIQEVIKKGQILLVQVQKEERGNKGASFTSYLSLAGKYCVLMPNNPGHHGISRRISNGEERRRLRDITSKLTNEQDSKVASIIVRTAGQGRSVSDIKRDYEYLVKLWNRIRELTLESRAPNLIHVEEGIIQQTIRDLFDINVQEIIIDGQEAYSSAQDFMNHLLPQYSKKIKLHNNLVPIFSQYGVESQLSALYQQTVYLPSGGYIIINPTEALTSIDVNSGRSTSERNIEETAVKTNVEAAKEISRQLKLRDISGLIVIDFIDMYESRNRKIVERSLKEYMAKDRAKIQLSQISSFGLLEMSRQRLRPSFLESHTIMCTHCNGKGIVRDDETNSMVILRTIENEIHELDADILNVYANSNIVIYILNNKRIELALIEEKYGIKLNFLIDLEATSDSFSIEKVVIPAHEDEVLYEENVKHERKELVITEDRYESPSEQEQKPKISSNKRRKWKDSKTDSREKEPKENPKPSKEENTDSTEEKKTSSPKPKKPARRKKPIKDKISAKKEE